MVVAALIGSQVHTQIAVEVQRAICKIAGSSHCGEGDDPSGDPEADAVYDNLGDVFEYYSDTFGRDSFAAVGLDGTWEAPEVEGC